MRPIDALLLLSLAASCLIAGCPWQPARPAENGAPVDDHPEDPKPAARRDPAVAPPPAPAPTVASAPRAPVAAHAVDAGQGNVAAASTASQADTRRAQRAVVERALAYDPADPLADLASADALSAEAKQVAQGELNGPCRWVTRPQRLWPQPAQLAVTSAGTAFIVGGYGSKGTPSAGAAQGETLFVLRLDDKGLPQLLHSSPVTPAHPGTRAAPPALAARHPASVTVAMTDGAGALKVGDVPTGGARADVRFETVAAGADTRYSPALAHLQAGTLVAFAKGTTPMQTHVALLRPKSGPPTVSNITPAHVGATAPAFASGQSPPRLYMVDARNGMSPLLVSRVEASGAVSQAKVVVPVGMVTSPTRLAVAHARFGTTLAYVGVGSAATTAIGLIDVAPTPGSPSPMIPGTSYGPLSVAAAASPDALYFAADAPTERGEKRPKRAIEIVRVGPGGTQARSTLTGGAADAYGVAIARNGDGLLGVAFNQPEAAYFARLRCR